MRLRGRLLASARLIGRTLRVSHPASEQHLADERADRASRDEHERWEAPAPVAAVGARAGHAQQEEEAEAVARADDRGGRGVAVDERDVEEHNAEMLPFNDTTFD